VRGDVRPPLAGRVPVAPQAPQAQPSAARQVDHVVGVDVPGVEVEDAEARLAFLGLDDVARALAEGVQEAVALAAHGEGAPAMAATSPSPVESTNTLAVKLAAPSARRP